MSHVNAGTGSQGSRGSTPPTPPPRKNAQRNATPEAEDSSDDDSSLGLGSFGSDSGESMTAEEVAALQAQYMQDYEASIVRFKADDDTNVVRTSDDTTAVPKDVDEPENPVPVTDASAAMIGEVVALIQEPQTPVTFAVDCEFVPAGSERFPEVLEEGTTGKCVPKMPLLARVLQSHAAISAGSLVVTFTAGFGLDQAALTLLKMGSGKQAFYDVAVSIASQLDKDQFKGAMTSLDRLKGELLECRVANKSQGERTLMAALGKAETVIDWLDYSVMLKAQKVLSELGVVMVAPVEDRGFKPLQTGVCKAVQAYDKKRHQKQTSGIRKGARKQALRQQLLLAERNYNDLAAHAADRWLARVERGLRDYPGTEQSVADIKEQLAIAKAAFNLQLREKAWNKAVGPYVHVARQFSALASANVALVDNAYRGAADATKPISAAVSAVLNLGYSIQFPDYSAVVDESARGTTTQILLDISTAFKDALGQKALFGGVLDLVVRGVVDVDDTDVITKAQEQERAVFFELVKEVMATVDRDIKSKRANSQSAVAAESGQAEHVRAVTAAVANIMMPAVGVADYVQEQALELGDPAQVGALSARYLQGLSRLIQPVVQALIAGDAE